MLDHPLTMTVRYWRGDERRRDVPGILDAICHVLERGGIVKDDALVQEVHWLPMGIRRDNPGAVILLEVLK